MNPVAKVLILLLVVSGPLGADTISLRDGTEYEGEILRQTKDSLVFCVRWGGMNGSVTIPKSEVLDIHIKPLAPDAVVAAAQALRNEAEEASMQKPQASDSKLQAGAGETPGSDLTIQNPKSRIPKRVAADAWVRLGEYYQRHPGYSAQAREAYEKALLYDNDHPVAREKLGYIKDGTQWLEKPKPKPAAPSENITIGLRREEQRPESKPEDRELKPEVPVASVPPVPPYGGYGWGGADLVVTTWPWYGYLRGYGGYYPYSYGFHGGLYSPGYSYAPYVPRYGYGGSWGRGGWGGGFGRHH